MFLILNDIALCTPHDTNITQPFHSSNDSPTPNNASFSRSLRRTEDSLHSLNFLCYLYRKFKIKMLMQNKENMSIL